MVIFYSVYWPKLGAHCQAVLGASEVFAVRLPAGEGAEDPVSGVRHGGREM